MGIVVVALGAHRHQVGDLVLAPRGVVDAGTLAGLFGAGVEPTAVDEHGRQPGDDRRPRASPAGSGTPRPADPDRARSCSPTSWAIRPTCRPLIGDFGLIGERFRGGVEGSTAGGGTDDLTKDRRREVVRVEPQARAEREKNPGDRPGNDRWVRRTAIVPPRTWMVLDSVSTGQARAHCGTRLVIAEEFQLGFRTSSMAPLMTA